MGRQLNKYGGHGPISNQYKLDRRKPLAQQHGESDRIYGYFLRYLDNPKRQLKDLAAELGMRADSLSVHKRKYQWELRAALGGKNTAKKEPPKKEPKAAKRGPGRPRKHPKAEAE